MKIFDFLEVKRDVDINYDLKNKGYGVKSRFVQRLLSFFSKGRFSFLRELNKTKIINKDNHFNQIIMTSENKEAKTYPRHQDRVYKKEDEHLPDILIYHGGCPDGIGGAWCFWRQDREGKTLQLHPGKFREDTPNVEGKHVLFVDFSYPKDVTERMLQTAASVRVLDHHKSTRPLEDIRHENFSLVLDMDRSGAQIAWDEYYGNGDRPWFIDDIGDRDLWRWDIPDSKATTRAMFGLGFYRDFEKFDKLYYMHRANLLDAGTYLLEDDERTYAMITSHAVDCLCTSPMDRKTSWKVRVVECDHTKASDVGNRLVEDGKCDFAAMFRYEILRDEWWVSLRANTESNVDLTEVVKHFGNGGGHAKAAGFTILGNLGHNIRTLFQPVAPEARFDLPLQINTQPGDLGNEPSQLDDNSSLDMIV